MSHLLIPAVPVHDPALVPVDFAAVERDVRRRLLAFGADLPPIPAPAAVGQAALQ